MIELHPIMGDANAKKMYSVTVRIDEETYNLLARFAREDRRSASDVARLLLERGASLARKDGKLFEGHTVFKREKVLNG